MCGGRWLPRRRLLTSFRARPCGVVSSRLGSDRRTFLSMKSERSLVFELAALQDLTWWIEQDRKKALRIIKLVEAIHRDPFKGLGEPEPLKGDLSGCWSRRIDREHRLVYEIFEDKIRILACRHHY
jgi:toxin YoeB